jgi:hypothetical protein
MKLKRNTFFLFLITLALVFNVYFFENKVHEITKEISYKQEILNRLSEDLKVLEAEWSYLNNPARLTQIASKINSEMKSPIKTQFTNLRDIPVREVMFTNIQSEENIP